MMGIRRRAQACAAVAATGVAMLACSTAQAQTRPASTGDGVPTGQLSTQMFNFGSYVSNGTAGSANPITGVSAACLTATTPACQRERLEGLFAFFQRKGVTNIELFSHAGFPANTDIPGLQAYRALLDKYGLHAAGWHGTVTVPGTAWTQRIAAAKILGADYIGSGGLADPGINTYANTLATAANLNALGKESVEAGVGPVYIHNHTGEFDAKYMDNGVLKWAWQIIMERTDPRYVNAELDVFWSSDAFNDVTGTASAALINNFPTRIRMLHIKDGINVAGQPGPTNSRSGSPRPTGTGEVDFRPIFAAAKNRVQYYHHEHDGGNVTDANLSFTNLKGINTASVPAVLGLPVSFPSVPAGTAAAANVIPVKIENTGDQLLNITALAITADAADVGDAADFAVVSNNCLPAAGGGPLAAGKLAVADDPETPADESSPAVPRGSCTVNVGFKPTRTNHQSAARLQVTSNADDATERILLVGKSTNDAVTTVGGDVPSVLNLQIQSNAGSFGTFAPMISRSYETALAATISTTTGNAALSVSDGSTTVPGHLVNGAFALPSVLNARAVNSANAGAAFVPLAEATGTPTQLLAYAAPTTSDVVTLGFRQAIGAGDVLRAGTYSKQLTFTLSTTTP
jgi:sugar phosphate isomerase/epimerase